MNGCTLAFLGHQPQISLAELKAVTHPDNILSHDTEIALLRKAPLEPDLMGGLVKMAVVFAITDSPKNIKETLKSHCLATVKKLKTGKITFGVSAYNLKYAPFSLRELNFFLKDVFKSQGRNARSILNDNQPLSPTQIFYHRLYLKNKFEICLWQFGKKIYLAQTVWVQNIETYREKDMSREKNLRAGIMSPKLAQIMLNLVATSSDDVVLDPFCGSGIILQEAILRNFKVIGSDLDYQQVKICLNNLKSFSKSKNKDLSNLLDLSTADATNHKWPAKIDLVVSETNLGPPLNRFASPQELKPIKLRLEKLLKEFLTNLAPQLKNSSRLCLAVPAWPQKNETHLTLNVVDCLEDLGYALVDCELIYRRPKQFVGRQFIVLKKI